MATTKTARKKATKKSAKAGKKVYTKRNSVDGVIISPVMDGVPMTNLRATETEKQQILTILPTLEPNRNHFVVAARLKGSVLRLASTEFPKYEMRTSLNRAKGIVSVWRVK